METIELWHIINGSYVHIVQVVDEDGEKTYYTNGIKETFNNTFTPEVCKDPV